MHFAMHAHVVCKLYKVIILKLYDVSEDLVQYTIDTLINDKLDET